MKLKLIVLLVILLSLTGCKTNEEIDEDPKGYVLTDLEGLTKDMEGIDINHESCVFDAGTVKYNHNVESQELVSMFETFSKKLCEEIDDKDATSVGFSYPYNLIATFIIEEDSYTLMIEMVSYDDELTDIDVRVLFTQGETTVKELYYSLDSNNTTDLMTYLDLNGYLD